MKWFLTQIIYVVLVATISLSLGVFSVRSAETEDRLVFVRNVTGAVRGQDKEIFITTDDGIERLTFNKRPDLYPSLSPDCARIAYTSDFWDRVDICVMDIDSLDIDRLTFSMKSDRYPTWSPDGRKIAFSSERDGAANIYIMNEDGKNMVQLTDNRGVDGYPDWSPDGRYIVFHNYLDIDVPPVLGQPMPPSANQIYLINVKSGLQRKLTEDLVGSLHPRWSPDGTQIAFLATVRVELPAWRYHHQICLIGIDGSGLEILTMDDDGIVDPTFSPDGKRVVFSSRKNDNWDIYSMDMETKAVARLTRDPDNDYQSDLSPDGDRIAFLSYRDDNVDIYSMDSDGGQLTNLTRSDVIERAPSWSPGGDKIAFTKYIKTDAGTQSIVCIMDSDGNNVVELADPPARNRSPVWSPGGDRIAFVNYPELGVYHARIYTMDVDGRNRQLLFDEPSGLIEEISWSPDGTQIAFIYNKEHSRPEIRLLNIIIRRASADVLTQKLGEIDAPGSPHGIDWSPDGKKLVFSASPPPPKRSEVFRDGLFFMDINGNVTRIIQERPTRPFGRFTWSPDGQKIIFSSKDNLYSLDLESEAIELFMEEAESPDWKNPARFYSVSPVGNLVTTWGRTKSALLQNYPNPFNPETWIPFAISKDEHVKIKVYNSTGQLVKTLDLGRKPSGAYLSKEEAAYWDGKNEAEEKVASGAYFYKITAGSYSAMRKMAVSQ